jgi:mannose-1-phosphate guanylyltransferase
MAVRKNSDMKGMKAVILVGGPGTRLQPLTNKIPKSIVPVLNRPVLEHMLAYLKQYGIEDIILTLNYLPDVIKDCFGDGSRYGVRLIYCMEDEPAGTAGAVKNTEKYLDGSFLVLNGDVFTDMDLAAMFSFHRKNKAQATISLSWVDNPSAFGVVETDDKGRVKRFIEKPPPGTETTNWINAGAYFLEPAVLDKIPAGRHYMFEKGLFPDLLESGAPVYGYPYNGYWLDMGTPLKYFSLNIDLLESRLKSRLVYDCRQDKTQSGQGSDIHSSANIKAPCVIGSGCRIGRNVNIKGPVVIGRNCVLEDGVCIEDAVLWDNVNIGAGSRLSRCIVSSNTVIGGNRSIENRVVTPSQNVPLK